MIKKNYLEEIHISLISRKQTSRPWRVLWAVSIFFWCYSRSAYRQLLRGMSANTWYAILSSFYQQKAKLRRALKLSSIKKNITSDV